ncbi:MAG: DUF1353 domain-containing protein [Gammaproteobacteria bacterium]|nr:DUF1353 domain-containing protein [Gammaproteobacteria bacterium]
MKTESSIYYRCGYKYQLARDYSCATGICSDQFIETDFIRFGIDGALLIRAGYAWDGPSGPAVDTKNFMRGSLVHDALYQLMREGRLSAETYRDRADRLLQQMCRVDGMSRLRAWWVHHGVAFGGGQAADTANDKETLTAP